MAAAEPYVILPLKRYKTLTNLSKEPQRSSLEAKEAAPSSVAPSNIHLKAQKFNQLKTLLREKQIIGFANEDQLIRKAIGASKSPLANEEVFFQKLFDNNMGQYITNPHVFAQYKPLWYRLSS